MKPRLGVLLLLPLLLTLTGLLMACQPQNGSPGDYLLYQTYPYRMEGRLTVDGDSHRIRLTAEEEGKRATVTFPDTDPLAGYTYELYRDADGTRWRIRYGTVRWEGDCGENLAGIPLIAELISLRAEDLTEVIVTKASGEPMNRLTLTLSEGECRVWLKRKDGIPCRMEAGIRGHSLIFEIETYQITEETNGTEEKTA